MSLSITSPMRISSVPRRHTEMLLITLHSNQSETPQLCLTEVYWFISNPLIATWKYSMSLKSGSAFPLKFKKWTSHTPFSYLLQNPCSNCVSVFFKRGGPTQGSFLLQNFGWSLSYPLTSHLWAPFLFLDPHCTLELLPQGRNCIFYC